MRTMVLGELRVWRGFDPARKTNGRPIQIDGREWPTVARVEFGPGGKRNSWPRPRLWPGMRDGARRTWALGRAELMQVWAESTVKQRKYVVSFPVVHSFLWQVAIWICVVLL